MSDEPTAPRTRSAKAKRAGKEGKPDPRSFRSATPSWKRRASFDGSCPLPTVQAGVCVAVRLSLPGTPEDAAAPPSATARVVMPDYFETTGIPIVRAAAPTVELVPIESLMGDRDRAPSQNRTAKRSIAA